MYAIRSYYDGEVLSFLDTYDEIDLANKSRITSYNVCYTKLLRILYILKNWI